MIYSILLVLALAAQGYARPNCFFACDYPVGQVPLPSYPAPGYPGPSGSLVQPGYPGPAQRPGYPYPPGNAGLVQPPSVVEMLPPSYPPRQPARLENFQPTSGGHMSFNHESQSSQKTSISGSYHFPAPSPPMHEPYYQPVQKPCRVYSDCS